MAGNEWSSFGWGVAKVVGVILLILGSIYLGIVLAASKFLQEWFK